MLELLFDALGLMGSVVCRGSLGPILFVIKLLGVAMRVVSRFQSETHWKWLLERPRSGRYMGVGYCNKAYLRLRLGFLVRKLRSFSEYRH